MSVLFFGQATGGNALAWFEFFNKNVKRVDVVFLARTACTLEHKFTVYAPYGRSEKNNIISKIRKKLASSLLLDLYLLYIKLFKKIDFVVLQGNYTPNTNLKVMKYVGAKTILNLYGSDFYRKYLRKELSKKQIESFLKVLRDVDVIMCNWKNTYDDFLKVFPEFETKTFFFPWGISPEWSSSVPSKRIGNEKKFISTRALHSYNNVDLVVDAFCQAYPSPSKNTLYIIGAYGNDKNVVKKINSLILKYGMEDRVSLELNKWYEGQELIDLYDAADFNFCFGDTDQLTISIVYAFTRKTVNILSPIPSYRYLKDISYNSPIIADSISVESLINVLNDIDKKNSDFLLEDDRVKAIEMFNMDNTFDYYINLINNER